ncbi:olfactory receptor 2AP1-like [Microcaecilia unicolor]|uniref:Olfactory receptor n=1 Tax=Microcaecilia unicolor TaxID=1415580 RepID=A0A6P7WWH6_9AMPH|nr:olfactory receptor 2AP1-like [Microcaecilia unicolor]
MSFAELRNKTFVTEFILLGLSDAPELRIFLPIMFSIIYIVTVTGNLLTICIIAVNYHLHSPMYFFLACLSLLEACFTSLFVPKMLVILVSEKKSISFSNCFIQCYFFYLLLGTDLSLLTVMSIDRYVAICRPMHYATIMTHRVCAQTVLGCWVTAFVLLLPTFILLLRSPFCGPNEINHFFCDGFELLKLSCGDTCVLKLFISIVSFTYLTGSSLVIAMSYIYILFTILKISSRTGRSKAFSTCTSHLSMVSISFGSASFIQATAYENNSRDLNKVVTLVAATLPPLLNPFIYTLRNQKVKKALRDAVRWNTLLKRI